MAARIKSEPMMTLFLDGELTVRDLYNVGEQVLRLGRRGFRGVALDFTDVAHLDYRGVKALMALTGDFRAKGGEVKLTGLSPYLAAVLRAAGAHSAFECYRHPDEREEAYARLGRPLLAH
ncbi:MAG: STAS domain-containing protein [Myxococcaceae bacterium]